MVIFKRLLKNVKWIWKQNKSEDERTRKCGKAWGTDTASGSNILWGTGNINATELCET